MRYPRKDGVQQLLDQAPLSNILWTPLGSLAQGLHHASSSIQTRAADKSSFKTLALSQVCQRVSIIV